MGLAGYLGAQGMGLVQLIFTVGGLGLTVAVSGVRFGAMRLVSEALGRGSDREAGAAVLRCLLYAGAFGCLSCVLLRRTAEALGFLWLEDGRTDTALRLLALELPFAALSAVFAGYFTATGRLGRAVSADMLQTLVCMALTALLLHRNRGADLGVQCACITAAGALSGAFGCCALALVYLCDRHSRPRTGQTPPGLTARLLGISLPLAVSAYARTGLSTVQHLFVLQGLQQYGLAPQRALGLYGLIHGMAFQLLLLPTAAVYAGAQLLVPRLTAMQVRREQDAICRLARRATVCTALYAGLCSLALLLFAGRLSRMLHQGPELALYLRCLTPLLPALYTDIAVDACLKGLGQQLWCMKVNLLEAALSLGLTWLLIPRFGLAGFFLVLYAETLMNFGLSLERLAWVLGKERCQGAADFV